MADPMAQARGAMARNDPAEALARYLRVLARDPGDLEALSGAGMAALAVGDADAAINFYARAEKIAPRDGRIKAGLGSALVQKEQSRAALKLFDTATDLGVPVADIALDRGLAYDLRGDNRRAQADYALAMHGLQANEAARRMALSMSIAGDRTGALAVLDPLLRRQDIPAWRARAFVLAMTGDAAGAEQAAYAVLPRTQADALKPFLERLPQLKAAEKAAAVHFGHFPENRVPQQQLADISPIASAKSSAGTVVAAVRPLPGGGGRDAPALFGRGVSSAKAGSTTVQPEPAEAGPSAAELRKQAAEKKLADRKEAAEKLAADKLADKKDREKEAAKTKAKEKTKAASSEPERYWVQIASGAYKPDLDKEWDKQKAKFAKQLAGKTPWTTPYKATNRLMVGPFATKAAAQAYVNDAGGKGFSTFPVTTPAGQKVERLQ